MNKFFRGFKYAFAGIVAAVRSELNMKVHCVVAVCVVLAGWLFQISGFEWIACLLCIGLVISAEMVNTAVEKMCNKFSPEKSEEIRFVKDVAAGAVLVCAIAAACVGLIIFLPKLLAIF